MDKLHLVRNPGYIITFSTLRSLVFTNGRFFTGFFLNLQINVFNIYEKTNTNSQVLYLSVHLTYLLVVFAGVDTSPATADLPTSSPCTHTRLQPSFSRTKTKQNSGQRLEEEKISASMVCRRPRNCPYVIRSHFEP